MRELRLRNAPSWAPRGPSSSVVIREVLGHREEGGLVLGVFEEVDGLLELAIVAEVFVFGGGVAEEDGGDAFADSAVEGGAAMGEEGVVYYYAVVAELLDEGGAHLRGEGEAGFEFAA